MRLRLRVKNKSQTKTKRRGQLQKDTNKKQEQCFPPKTLHIVRKKICVGLKIKPPRLCDTDFFEIKNNRRYFTNVFPYNVVVKKGKVFISFLYKVVFFDVFGNT